ncbi:MAG: cytotoxic translational repressor of toxin-antitoxin stability system [Bdellovibrionota bacterium]
MGWLVIWKKRVEKQIRILPEPAMASFDALAEDIRQSGRVRGNWKNYSKLQGDRHHCHIKSGRPTYVACWEVTDKVSKKVEVYYVGTHEKAPY